LDRQLECGPMPNVMAALPNIGGAAIQHRKVWLTPTTRVPRSNATKTRNPLKLAGCPRLANRSQALMGRSSPYCKNIWGKYCCLTSFFPTADKCLRCEDIARQSCAMVRRWRILGDFFASCICSEPRAARFRPAS